MGRSVLITGCNGYIGADVAVTFKQHGWSVYGIDMLPPTARQQGLFDDFICGEVQDQTRKTLPEVDAILHFAAESRLVDNLSEVHYYNHNVLSTKRLYEIYDAPIYLASTTAMYNEAREVEHKHYYSGSKVLAEDFVDVSFRQGTVVGANYNGVFRGVVDLMIDNAVKKGEITVAQPRKWRPLAGLTYLSNMWYRYVDNGTLVQPELRSQLGRVVVMHLWETCCTIGDIAQAVVDMLMKKLERSKADDLGLFPLAIELQEQEDLEGIEKKAPYISSKTPDYEHSPVYVTRLYRLVTEAIERYEISVGINGYKPAKLGWEEGGTLEEA